MKVEAKIMLGLGLFFGLMVAVYWNWGHENAGSVMMFAGMLLGFLPGSYYYWWSRRMTARPEDDSNATQAQGAGVVGAFPGTSIWPFTLGMGTTTVMAPSMFSPKWVIRIASARAEAELGTASEVVRRWPSWW